MTISEATILTGAIITALSVTCFVLRLIAYGIRKVYKNTVMGKALEVLTACGAALAFFGIITLLAALALIITEN